MSRLRIALGLAAIALAAPVMAQQGPDQAKAREDFVACANRLRPDRTIARSPSS